MAAVRDNKNGDGNRDGNRDGDDDDDDDEKDKDDDDEPCHHHIYDIKYSQIYYLISSKNPPKKNSTPNPP